MTSLPIHAYLAQEALGCLAQTLNNKLLMYPPCTAALMENFSDRICSRRDPAALDRKERKERQRHKSLAFCLFLGNLFPPAWKCGDE